MPHITSNIGLHDIDMMLLLLMLLLPSPLIEAGADFEI
jgi:hypothetical protein